MGVPWMEVTQVTKRRELGLRDSILGVSYSTCLPGL